MAKPELPALDFVVEELLLEALGGPGAARARRLAESLELHVTGGATLSKHRKQLARAVGSFADRATRVRTLRVLATEAERAGDEKTLAQLEKLEPTLREKLQRRAKVESAKPRLDLCAKVERVCLRGESPDDGDVTRLLGWLGTAPEGRGHARVDLGHRACIALMRVVCHPRAGKKAHADLQRKLDVAGAAANDARRALVAAAAYQEQWKDVDALSKVTGAALLSVAGGLDIAAWYRLSDRSIALARQEGGAPLPEFRSEIEPRLRALAKRGPAAVAKQCEEVLSTLERGR